MGTVYGHQKAVLFVDDEECVLHSLKRSLYDEPYECIIVSDAMVALEVLQFTRIYAIVADLCMPGMEG